MQKMKDKILLKVFNSEQGDKVKSSLHVDKNAFTDKGNGEIHFKNGLTITDGSEQWNGTRYDMRTYDVSEYNGQLTADHNSSIESLLGKVFGLKKTDKRVSIEGIKFAVDQNPLARYAYEMIKAGYLNDFSTETVGKWPDDDGIYYDSKLVGLSVVVVGNNKSARINEIALNSIKEAEAKGLDTKDLQMFLNSPIDKKEDVSDNADNNMKLKKVLNTRDFAVTLEYKSPLGETEKVTIQPNQAIFVAETEAEAVENAIKDSVAPKKEEVKEEKKETAKNEITVEEAVKNAVETATAPLVAKVKELEGTFDNSVKEPTFSRVTNSGSIITNKLSELEGRERTGQQILAGWRALKERNATAQFQLNEINKINLEKLKEKGMVRNSITIEDMGGFVFAPEMFTKIEGHRSNFRAILDKVNFVETLSLEMAWLKRNGDVDMEEVEFCDDGADGNLKPIKEYDAGINRSPLSEVAAVTPVCNAATRFLAADLMEDIAQGYRTAWDRKRAQLLVVRLQQAANANGNKKIYNTASASTLNPLFSMIDVASEVAEIVESGVWMFNTKTYYELMRRRMTASQNQDGGFPLFTTGDVGPLFLGSPYVIVPNELMPTLNTAETKTFVVDGVSVTIDQAMFYFDPSTISARQSGGLQYDLSTDASYEVGGGVVRSAFQRNELVVRGSGFRGLAVRDDEKVASMGAPGVS